MVPNRYTNFVISVFVRSNNLIILTNGIDTIDSVIPINATITQPIL